MKTIEIKTDRFELIYRYANDVDIEFLEKLKKLIDKNDEDDDVSASDTTSLTLQYLLLIYEINELFKLKLNENEK